MRGPGGERPRPAPPVARRRTAGSSRAADSGSPEDRARRSRGCCRPAPRAPRPPPPAGRSGRPGGRSRQQRRRRAPRTRRRGAAPPGPAGGSRAWLQSSVARSERWRSSARWPPVSIGSRSARPASSPSSPITGRRAAASSIARAMPSSASQTAATREPQVRGRAPRPPLPLAPRTAARRRRGRRPGRGEPGHREDRLERDGEPGAAVARTTRPPLASSRCSTSGATAVEQVLAVVEHEQQIAPGEEGCEPVGERAILPLAGPRAPRRWQARPAPGRSPGRGPRTTTPSAIPVDSARPSPPEREPGLPTPPGPSAVTRRCPPSAAARAARSASRPTKRRDGRPRGVPRSGSRTAAGRAQRRAGPAGRSWPSCGAARRRGSRPSGPR